MQDRSDRAITQSIRPISKTVSTWSGKYGFPCGPNFSSWQVCPARLESVHDRREESSIRSARKARRSKGGKAHAAKMTPEGRSKSARTVLLRHVGLRGGE